MICPPQIVPINARRLPHTIEMNAWIGSTTLEVLGLSLRQRTVHDLSSHSGSRGHKPSRAIPFHPRSSFDLQGMHALRRHGTTGNLRLRITVRQNAAPATHTLRTPAAAPATQPAATPAHHHYAPARDPAAQPRPNRRPRRTPCSRNTVGEILRPNPPAGRECTLVSISTTLTKRRRTNANGHSSDQKGGGYYRVQHWPEGLI